MMPPSKSCSVFFATILLRANTALALATAPDAVQRLDRLFTDIGESVHKAGEDTELVFSQLYGFDQRLEANLVHEISMLNTTQTRLSELQTKYRMETNRSANELARLETALRGSTATDAHFKASASHAGTTFDGFHKMIAHTVASLRRAVMATKAATGDHSVTSVNIPKDIAADVRRLLVAKRGENLHKGPREHFRDVFQVFDADRLPESLTPALVGRTVALLRKLTASATQRRAGLLVQLQGRRQRLAGRATDASSRADTARTMLSEDERNSGELSFSVGFSNAAESMDKEFLKRVREHMKVKADLIVQLRTARTGQLTTLKELVDLVAARRVESAAPPGDEPEAASAALSFLQRSPSSKRPVARKAPPMNNFSSLQTEIESALRQKVDTHAILLRVKAALAPTPSIDVGGVRDVVTAMGGALRAVDSVQASAEDATRDCAAQRFSVGEEQRRLRETLSLAAASRKHTDKAIHAARRNLDGIVSKAETLNRSALELAHMGSRVTKILERQRRDRATIDAALRKAKTLAQQSLSPENAPATVALIERLLEQFHSEEKGERAYQTQHVALEQDDAEYTRDYSQLLTERKLHYQASLSALELYASELAGDANAKETALDEGAQLQSAGGDLCDSILAFYKKHNARREHLSQVLREVLPKIPEVLGLGDGHSDDGAMPVP